MRGEAATEAEKRAGSPNSARTSSSNSASAGPCSRAAIGSSRVVPGASGELVGPQVCLGMFRSSSEQALNFSTTLVAYLVISHARRPYEGTGTTDSGVVTVL
ncbi:hypothetical protein GCM10010317_024990 [Streptomyces mirabilis]|nr:hypothetical protein GCM10010317_024990 [Streptomyces mirabilis]